MINSTVSGDITLPVNNSPYIASFVLNAFSILTSIASIVFSLQDRNNLIFTSIECISLGLIIIFTILNIVFTALKEAYLGINICNYFAILICTVQFLCFSYEGKIGFQDKRRVCTFISSMIISAMMIANVIYVNTYTYKENSDGNKIGFATTSGVLALATLGISIFQMAKDANKKSISHISSSIWHTLCLVFLCVGSTTLVNQLSFLTGGNGITTLTYSNIVDESNPALTHTITVIMNQGVIISIVDDEYTLSGTFIQTTTYDLMNNTTSINRTQTTPVSKSVSSSMKKTSATINRTGTTELNHVKLLPHITKLVGMSSTTQTTLTNVVGPNNTSLLHNITYTVHTSDNQVLLVKDVITTNDDKKTYVCTQTYNILHDYMTSINSSNVDNIVYEPVIRPYILSNADSKWIITNEISQTIKNNVGFVVNASNSSLIHQLNYVIENNIVVAVEDKVHTNDTARTYLCTVMYDISNNVSTITDTSGQISFNNFIALPNHIINNCNAAWQLSPNTLNTTQVISATDSNKPNMTHAVTLTLNSSNQVISIQDVCTLNGNPVETETYDLLSNVTTNLMPSRVISANSGVNIPKFLEDAIIATGANILKLTSSETKTPLNQSTKNNVSDIFNPNVTHNITYSYNAKNVITEIVDNIYANEALLTTITYDLSINIRNINNGSDVTSYSGVVLYDYLLSKADGKLTIPSTIAKPFITQKTINSVMDDIGNTHNLTLICNGDNVLMIKDNETIYDINSRFTTVNGVSTNGVRIQSFILDAIKAYNNTNNTQLSIPSDVQSNNIIKRGSYTDSYNSHLAHDVKFVFNSNEQLIWIEDTTKLGTEVIQIEKYDVLSRSKIVTPMNGIAYRVENIMYPVYMSEHVNNEQILGSSSKTLYITRDNLNIVLSNGVYHNIKYIVDNNNVIGIVDNIYNASSHTLIATETYSFLNGIKVRKIEDTNNIKAFTSFIMPSYITANMNSDWLEVGTIKKTDNYTYELNENNTYNTANNVTDIYNSLTTHDIKYIYDNNTNKNVIYIEDTTYISNGQSRIVVQNELYDLINGMRYTSNTANSNTFTPIGIFTPIPTHISAIDESKLPTYIRTHVPTRATMTSSNIENKTISKSGVMDSNSKGLMHDIVYVMDHNNKLLCVKDEMYVNNNSIIRTTIIDINSGITTSKLTGGPIEVSQQLLMTPTLVDNAPIFVTIPSNVIQLNDLVVYKTNSMANSPTGIMYSIEYMKDRNNNLISVTCRAYNSHEYNKGNKRAFQTETYDFLNGFKSISNINGTVISDDNRIPSIIYDAIGSINLSQDKILTPHDDFTKIDVIDAKNPTLKHSLTYEVTSNGEILYVSDTVMNLNNEYISSCTYDLISNVLIGNNDVFTLNPIIPNYINDNKTNQTYTNTNFLGYVKIENTNEVDIENTDDKFNDTELNKYIKHNLKYYVDENRIVVIKDEHVNISDDNTILRTDYYDFNNNIQSTVWPNGNIEYKTGLSIIGNSYLLNNSPKSINAKYIGARLSESYKDTTSVDHNEMVNNRADYYYVYNGELMVLKNIETALNSDNTLIRTVYYDRYRNVKIIDDGLTVRSEELYIPKSLAEKNDPTKIAIDGTIVIDYVRGNGLNIDHSAYSNIKHVIKYVTEGNKLVAVEDTCVAIGVSTNDTFTAVTIGNESGYMINKKIYDMKRGMTFINENGEVKTSELRIPHYIKLTNNALNSQINDNLFIPEDSISTLHTNVNRYNDMITNNVRYVYGSDGSAVMIINERKGEDSGVIDRKIYDITNEVTIVEKYKSDGTMESRVLKRGIKIGHDELSGTHISQYKIDSKYIEGEYRTKDVKLVDPINNTLEHNVRYVYNSSNEVIYIINTISSPLLLSNTINEYVYLSGHTIKNEVTNNSYEINDSTVVPKFIMDNLVNNGLKGSIYTIETNTGTTTTNTYSRLIVNSTNVLGDYIEENITNTINGEGRILLQRITRNIMNNGTDSALNKSTKGIVYEVIYDYINNMTIRMSGSTVNIENGTGENTSADPYISPGSMMITQSNTTSGNTNVTTYEANGMILRIIEDVINNDGSITSTYYDLTSHPDKYIKIVLDEMDGIILHNVIDKNMLPGNIDSIVNGPSSIILNNIDLMPLAVDGNFTYADIEYITDAQQNVTKIIEKTKAISYETNNYVYLTETIYDLVNNTTTINYLFNTSLAPVIINNVELTSDLTSHSSLSTLTFPSNINIINTYIPWQNATPSSYEIISQNTSLGIQQDTTTNSLVKKTSSSGKELSFVIRSVTRILVDKHTYIIHDKLRNMSMLFVGLKLHTVTKLTAPFVIPQTVVPTVDLITGTNDLGQYVEITYHSNPTTNAILRITEHTYTDSTKSIWISGTRYDTIPFDGFYITSAIDSTGKAIETTGVTKIPTTKTSQTKTA